MISDLAPEKEKQLLNLIKINRFDRLVELVCISPKVVDQKMPMMGLYLAHAVISQNSRNNNNIHLSAQAKRQIQQRIIEVLWMLNDKSQSALSHFDDRGYHMLHYACLFGYIEVLKIFYDEEKKNIKNGETLLMSAIRFDNIQCVDFLIARQPWILQLNNNKKSALDIARQLNIHRCIEKLEQSRKRQEKILLLRQLRFKNDSIQDENITSVRRILGTLYGYHEFFFSLF